MNPITIFILTFLSLSQNWVFSQSQPTSAHWLSDGSSAIKIQNDSISSDPPKNAGSYSYGAMWIDGSGFNTGEHFWTIKLTGIKNGASVGLSNKQFFDKGYDCKGVFYNGNLATCGRSLVQSFGPGIHQSNSTIGLLISFTESEGRLKIYYFQNGKSLGLAYDIPANTIPNLYPMVRFGGVGSATIQKETQIPDAATRKRFKETYEGIEGPWKVDLETVLVDGILLSQQKPENEFDSLPPAALQITPDVKIDGKFDINLKVVNRWWFTAKRTRDSWKNLNDESSTLIGSFGRAQILDNGLSHLVHNPETISINSKGQLEIVKGMSKAILDRYDDIPAHFEGVPFEST